MSSVNRVLDALNHRVPDQVPYLYSHIARNVREAILGRELDYEYHPEIPDFGPYGRPGDDIQLHPREATDGGVARILGLDGVGMDFFPPFFVEVGESNDGGLHIKKGLLTSMEALDKVRLPDLDRPEVFKPAEEFISRYKGEFAVYGRIRIGVSYIMNSMGLDGFSMAIYQNPELVKEAVARYSKWVSTLCDRLTELGFDFLWTFDDMAYKTSTMFSPATWDQFFAPYVKKTVAGLKVPLIFHSDGNLLPVIERLLDLGISGLHPLEPGSMDLAHLKKNFGDRVCLVGNVDIVETLTYGTLEDVEQEVKDRIELLGPGGNYIISDSNSVPGYCKPENVLAMGRAVKKHGKIY